jgi:hypothetical protein
MRDADRPRTPSAMRDLDVTDSELRLLIAVRRSCQELDGRTPSTRLIDSLLDERAQLSPIRSIVVAGVGDLHGKSGVERNVLLRLRVPALHLLEYLLALIR